MLIGLLLGVPLISALLLAFLGGNRYAHGVNISASLITFIQALLLAWQISQMNTIIVYHDWFYVDKFSVFLLVMVTFVGLSTAIFSVKYLDNEVHQQVTSIKKLRFFYSLYQLFFFAALLILMTNNLGVLWVAMEFATLCTVILVAFNRTTQSLEAAWKYLILCGLGLAQALLGTILLYLSVDGLLDAHHALHWTALYEVRNELPAAIVQLAFVFIFVGYGTKAGFVPLHHWLPDVYGQSLAPVLCLLSGVLLNLAFYAILRFKLIVDGALDSHFTNVFFLAFGLFNIVLAAFFLLRQKEVNRILAYSSIEHVGLMSVAFGIGTPLAIFAGLLHMLAHALAKTSAFFSAGQIIQTRKSHMALDIRGLAFDKPGLGWGILLSSCILIGLPPSILFISEFLIVFSMFKQHMLLAIPMMLGLLIAAVAIFYRVQQMVFLPCDETPPEPNLSFSILPIYLHIVLLGILGISIPLYLSGWFESIIILMSAE